MSRKKIPNIWGFLHDPSCELELQASKRLLKVVLRNFYIELPLLRYNRAYIKNID